MKSKKQNKSAKVVDRSCSSSSDEEVKKKDEKEGNDAVKDEADSYGGAESSEEEMPYSATNLPLDLIYPAYKYQACRYPTAMFVPSYQVLLILARSTIQNRDANINFYYDHEAETIRMKRIKSLEKDNVLIWLTA